jgi:ABC-type transport system involved in multi-copper enzyme maturation permease subunit
MTRVWAIARLTFAEGVRMRIVLVFLVVLVILVLRMPFTLRGDETLTGRLQNFLSYSLGALGALLSLATVFFSCSTLATELRECSLHLVVTKPVSRFQILLGKWLGVNLLNLLIVVLCGATIYGLASFIKSRPEQFARDRLQVRDVVWTARIAAQPVLPEQEIAAAAVERVKKRVESGEIEPSQQKAQFAEIIKQYKTQWRQVENGGQRFYEFSGLPQPEREDDVIQIRYTVMAIPLPPQEVVNIGWVFCDPDSGAPLHPPVMTAERYGQKHQFLVRASAVVKDGRAVLGVHNPYNPDRATTVYFEGDDSLEVLYRVGGFESNYVKALAIIMMRLMLLSAIGLFFSVFVSFPVACLCASVFYVVCLALPFIFESIGAFDKAMTPQLDPYGQFGPLVRAFLVPFLQVAFPDFGQYSGVDHLIEGEYIAPGLLGWSFFRTLLYGGALLLLPGWWIFHRREVAEVTV